MRNYEVYIGSSTGSEVLSVETVEGNPGVVRFVAHIPADAIAGPEVPFVVVIDRDYTTASYSQQITDGCQVGKQHA